MFIGVPATIPAHPLTFTNTLLSIEANNAFTASLLYDLDALALGAPLETNDADLVKVLTSLSPDEFSERIDRLRRLFKRRVRIRFDGQPQDFDVSFPDYGTSRTRETEIPTVLGLTAQLSGTIPPGTKTVEFFASRAFGEVHLTIVDDVRNIEMRSILEPGERSQTFSLIDPVPQAQYNSNALHYLRLGFVHIVPNGVDHILFVLGLFLLSSKLRPLLWQVTSFTIAHAVTLTLATFEFVALSGALVEPLIALSIAYVAIENTLTERLTRWRPVIVFAFGLLHGLGFASVLNELGLPTETRLISLINFNVGIELGQFTVIGVAAALLNWCRIKPWYRRRVVVPISLGLALIGLSWAVERVLNP